MPRANWAPQRFSLGRFQRPVVQPTRSVPSRSGRGFGGNPIASPFTKGSFHDVSAVEHAAAHSVSAHDLPSHGGSLPEVRSPIRTMMQRGLLTKACAQVDKTERPAHVNGHVKVGASHHETVCKGWPGPIQAMRLQNSSVGFTNRDYQMNFEIAKGARCIHEKSTFVAGVRGGRRRLRRRPIRDSLPFQVNIKEGHPKEGRRR